MVVQPAKTQEYILWPQIILVCVHAEISFESKLDSSRSGFGQYKLWQLTYHTIQEDFGIINQLYNRKVFVFALVGN